MDIKWKDPRTLYARACNLLIGYAPDTKMTQKEFRLELSKHFGSSLNQISKLYQSMLFWELIREENEYVIINEVKNKP